MSRIITPTQLRVNDPYQQRLLQFDTVDSRVYLSRVSNYLLKSFGNDAVIKGLKVTDISLDSTVISLTISPGLVIQDSTLIEITSESIISLDLNGLDSCNGYLILYTNYQYLNVIDSNKFIIKLSYITKDGLDIIPINDLWDKNRNRVYLGLFRFDNTYNLTEVINPNFFYISGKIFYRRGKLNFLPVEDTTSSISPFYYHLPHGFNSNLIFSQLIDENYTQKYINTLKLFDTNIIDISIDEYKDFEDYYQLILADPADIEEFEILKVSLDVDYKYTLTHNYDQKYVQIQIYNDSKELVHPRFIKFINNNSILIDFSNLREDLADKYKVLLIKNISIQTIQSNDFISEQIQVDHNLNKFNILTQIVNNTTDKLYNGSITSLNDNNSVLINTTICDIVPDSYTILFYKNTRLLFNLYNNNTYIIPYHVYTKQFTTNDLVNSSLIVNHNLNNNYPIVQLLDLNNNIVQANEIYIIDENNIRLDFIIGSLNELLTVIIFSYFSDDIFILSETTTGIYVLNLENTRYNNPLFQIYNSEKYIIQPDVITKSNNIYTFEFKISVGIINILVTEGFNNYSSIFSLTEIPFGREIISINHNLDTLYPIVQVYNNDQIFYPNNIQIINSNELELDLAASEFDYQINIISGISKKPILYTSSTSFVYEFGSELKINNKVLITHNLSSIYLLINIYDNENNLILPLIKILNYNQIEIDLPFMVVLDFFKIVILKII